MYIKTIITWLLLLGIIVLPVILAQDGDGEPAAEPEEEGEGKNYCSCIYTTCDDVPVLFLPSWRNFGDIVLKFCICCQIHQVESSNFKNVA